ncbi:MAG TPA: CHASE2 domain-containing protein, partial [Spirochaetota bacterium]|nr:CHASE2 domain-containing protein [Spirochaetota bacterium]
MKLSENAVLKNVLVAFLVTVLSLVLSVLFSFTDVYNRLEDAVYDNFFRTVKVDKNKTDSVAIVAIDDMSLIEGDNRGVFWPWSRDMYAIISKFLVDQGAKAVIFDILFTGPDMDRADSLGSENDRKFYDTISETNKVILAFNIDNRFAKEDTLNVQKINKLENVENIKEYKYLFSPYSFFTENNKNFGFVDIDSESDGVVREYRPLVKIKDKFYPSLALSAYLIANSIEFPEDLKLNENGNFELKWYGEGGTRFSDKGEIDNLKSTFNYYSAWYVFYNALRYSRGKDYDIKPETFKDKVVFIGASARGLLDQKNTPFTNKGNAYPGVEIHATAYLNMLNKDWLKTNPLYLEIIIFFLVVLLLAFFGVNAKSLAKYSVVFFALLLIGALTSYLLFYNFNISSKIVLFVILLLILYLVVLIVNYIFVGHNRNVIKNVFGTYLSPELVKKISDANKPIAAD